MRQFSSRLFSHPERTLLLLAALPIAFVVILVINYGYTVPWMDEYAHILRLVRDHVNGELTLAQVAGQFGDHRLLFPFLLSLLFVQVSGGNTALEMGFSILVMLASLFLVYRIYRLQHRQQEHAIYFIIPAAFLIFSLGQRDNWIWGSQKCIFIMLTCLYVVAWALERFPRSKTTFAIAVLAAVIASWSFLSGNVLWFIIPVALWLNGYRKISTYLLWIALAAVHFFLFLNGYVRVEEGAPAALPSLFANIRYVLTYLGSPLSPETHFLLQEFAQPGNRPRTTYYAGIIGALGVVVMGINLVYAFFVRRISLREFSPWALLIAFSVGNGVLLSLGRSWEYFFALAARYITLALPFWVSLVAVMVANTADYWHRRVLPGWSARALLIFNIVVSIAFIGGFTANMFRAVDGRKTLKDVMETCYLTTMRGDSRCLQPQFFANYDPGDLAYMQQILTFMHQHSMYILRQPLTSLDLLDSPMNVLHGADIRLMDYLLPGGTSARVLFMHAPATIEQEIIVPETSGSLSLKTAAFLETNTLTSDPTVPQDGAVFRIQLLDQDRSELASREMVFESTVGHPPIPVEFDLSAYKGRSLVVVYQTENRELPGYDWTMWVNPHIEISSAE